MARTLVEMAADIVQSQASNRPMSTEELTSALQSTFKALQGIQAQETTALLTEGAQAAEEGAAPVMSPEKSIKRNTITCLECGQEFKMLSPKHLREHGLTGRDYRKKYGFSLRQPLCAKSVSERRKKAGKDRGLPENLRKAIAARKKARKKSQAEK
jgi:predicted transcriptional regulator